MPPVLIRRFAYEIAIVNRSFPSAQRLTNATTEHRYTVTIPLDTAVLGYGKASPDVQDRNVAPKRLRNVNPWTDRRSKKKRRFRRDDGRGERRPSNSSVSNFRRTTTHFERRTNGGARRLPDVHRERDADRRNYERELGEAFGETTY